MRKLIGILGGSFDPIHLGHLNLAVAIMEAHSLFQVWFCPAAQNPLKPNDTNASAHHRMEMVRLAIAGEPRFKVIDTDITRKGPSYTIDTLKALDALNLETAVQDGKVMQDFELESLITGGEHSQKVKAPPVISDYGSKDCVNLPSSTAVSRFNLRSFQCGGRVFPDISRRRSLSNLS